MDWKLFASTFAAVFLAEIGDKTQLATLSLAAGSPGLRPRLVVFAGAALALVSTSALAVLVGDQLTRVVPVAWLRRIAGLLMLVLGALLVWGGPRSL